MSQGPKETVARSALYKLLSLAFLPLAGAAEVSAVLRDIDSVLRDLPEGHRAVLQPIVGGAAITAATPTPGEYGRLFGVGLAATPYETEYDPLASARKGHRLADLLGFYEAFGVRLAGGANEFPDHIAVELEFMSFLLLKAAHAQIEGLDEPRAVSETAAVAFLTDHLGAWAGTFADRAESATEEEFYKFAARLLREFLFADCRFLGLEPLPIGAAPRATEVLACPLGERCPERIP